MMANDTTMRGPQRRTIPPSEDDRVWFVTVSLGWMIDGKQLANPKQELEAVPLQGITW